MSLKCKGLSFFLIIASCFYLGAQGQKAHASTITQDPQYVVINISDFYFADWGASEASWETKVKPDLITTINQIKETLGTGTENRKLAWSTLLEYTDFLMDTPSPDSRYVVQARRIMELAEDTDLPVFMPLNGFQWWNEVPELWNHWDYDGNQTPGCENDRYDKIVGYTGTDPIYSCKMPKLRDPAFRKRFIAGYNPENKWNVEWQDWTTPMRLNWRNWGGGGFQLAPPPNLVAHQHTTHTYKDFQTARFEAIVRTIAGQYQKWEKEGRSDLFAGLTIGTEVSLNASVTKQDEFEPYGYRGIQDLLCPAENPACANNNPLDEKTVRQLRQQVVNTYLTDLSARAVRLGLPKQRVYTHVWSEAKVGEPRYENYLAASLNWYARPTLSLYGYSQDPMSLPLLGSALQQHDHLAWGAGEFGTTLDTTSWQKALKNTLDDPVAPAQVIDIYNWAEHKNTPAIPVIRDFLTKEYRDPRELSEVLVEHTPVQISPEHLSWSFSMATDSAQTQELRVFKTRESILSSTEAATQTMDLPVETTQWEISDLSPGFYHWVVSRRRVSDELESYQTTSQPERFLIELPVPTDNSPWWVKKLLDLTVHDE